MFLMWLIAIPLAPIVLSAVLVWGLINPARFIGIVSNPVAIGAETLGLDASVYRLQMFRLVRKNFEANHTQLERRAGLAQIIIALSMLGFIASLFWVAGVMAYMRVNPLPILGG